MSEPAAIAPRQGSHEKIDAVSIRRVDPGDRLELAEFYARLSPASRQRRFMSRDMTLGATRIRALCEPDHVLCEGFVATVRTSDRDDGRVVGHLCLDAASRDAVEVAVAVADDARHRGIGRRLFEAALAWAAASGYRQMVATACADNVAVLRLLTSAPLGIRSWPAEGGLVDIEIPLVAADAVRPGGAP